MSFQDCFVSKRLFTPRVTVLHQELLRSWTLFPKHVVYIILRLKKKSNDTYRGFLHKIEKKKKKSDFVLHSSQTSSNICSLIRKVSPQTTDNCSFNLIGDCDY